MQSLYYLLKRRSIRIVMFIEIILCFLLRFLVYSETNIDYLSMIAILWLYSAFPLLYYLFIGMYRQYITNTFISIRLEKIQKHILIDQLIITTFFTFFTMFVIYLPCLFNFEFSNLGYLIDMLLLFFSIFLFFIQVVELLGRHIKYENALTLAIMIMAVFYLFGIYSSRFPIVPSFGQTFRLIIDGILLFVSILLIFIRAGEKNV